MELFPHNQETYNKVYGMLESTGKCCLIQGTGTGKSYILMKLLSTIFKDKNVVIVVPRESIATSIQLYDDWDFDNVKFMCYHSLKNLETADVVVFDELHRAGAPTWEVEVKRLMSRATYTLGMTATQFRFLDSNRDMATLLFGDSVVFGLSREEAIAKGVLPAFDYVAILSDVEDVVGSIDVSSLPSDLRVRYKALCLDDYQMASRLRIHVEGHKKVVVFYPNLETMEQADLDLKNWFNEDIHIYSVHSKKTRKQNRDQIKAFNEDKELCVIKSVSMLNEGIHLEGVTLVIFAQKTQSGNVFEQQLGRALSVTKPSIRPKYIDLVRNFENMRTIRKSAEITDKVSKKLDDAIDGVKILVTYDEVLLDIDKLLHDINNKINDYTDDIIRIYYPIEGNQCVRRLDGWTQKEVTRRARILGVTKNMAWTADEDNILRFYYPTGRFTVWKFLPGRSQSSIDSRARKLGIGTGWKKDEDLLIIKNLETMGLNWVNMNLPGKSEEEIMKRIERLGLREFI